MPANGAPRRFEGLLLGWNWKVVEFSSKTVPLHRLVEGAGWFVRRLLGLLVQPLNAPTTPRFVTTGRGNGLAPAHSKVNFLVKSLNVKR